MPLKRYLEGLIAQDLEKKMVFLTGPRQVGKTTLAKGLLGRWFAVEAKLSETKIARLWPTLRSASQSLTFFRWS